MKSIFIFKLPALLLVVLLLLSVSAAPAPVKNGALADGRPLVADWWQSYEQNQSPKSPPEQIFVYRLDFRELVDRLQPFRERLAELTRLKGRVLNNLKTLQALSQAQKATLGTSFYPWDYESLTAEGNAYKILEKLKQEKEAVAEVESVLYDVAKHLPDVSL